MRFPNVGAVYDRPQFRGMQSSKLWAVIDRPYIGDWAGFRIEGGGHRARLQPLTSQQPAAARRR
jgi:hypothetical protein